MSFGGLEAEVSVKPAVNSADRRTGAIPKRGPNHKNEKVFETTVCTSILHIFAHLAILPIVNQCFCSLPEWTDQVAHAAEEPLTACKPTLRRGQERVCKTTFIQHDHIVYSLFVMDMLFIIFGYLLLHCFFICIFASKTINICFFQ